MQRTLLILRHGKSEHGTGHQSDFERPLAPRGEQSARRMAELMDELDLRPDHIVSSGAVRALATAKLVSKALDVEKCTDESIYAAELSALLAVCRALDDDHERVLLVGHNPGFEELVDCLTGRRDTIMKTCTLAVITFDTLTRWAEITGGTGELAGIYHPREV